MSAQALFIILILLRKVLFNCETLSGDTFLSIACAIQVSFNLNLADCSSPSVTSLSGSNMIFFYFNNVGKNQAGDYRVAHFHQIPHGSFKL